MSDPQPPYVRFEVRPVEDREASIEAGKFIAKDVIFAIITPSGSKDILEKVAEEWLAGLAESVQNDRIPANWLQAYRHAYQSFKETREVPEIGTPIARCSLFSPAQVKNILDANIRTVEDLANANEEGILSIGMGGRALKEMAKDWLSTAEKQGKIAGELNALRTRNEELEARDAAREEEFKALKKQVETLEKAMEKTS